MILCRTAARAGTVSFQRMFMMLLDLAAVPHYRLVGLASAIMEGPGRSLLQELSRACVFAPCPGHLRPHGRRDWGFPSAARLRWRDCRVVTSRLAVHLGRLACFGDVAEPTSLAHQRDNGEPGLTPAAPWRRRILLRWSQIPVERGLVGKKPGCIPPVLFSMASPRQLSTCSPNCWVQAVRRQRILASFAIGLAQGRCVIRAWVARPVINAPCYRINANREKPQALNTCAGPCDETGRCYTNWKM